MKRMFAVVVTWAAVAISMLHAVPARPLYVPDTPVAPPARPVVDLRGTAWLGKYLTVNRTYIFEADGTVSYSTTGTTVFKQRGNWRYDGAILFFDHHIGVNKLIEFRGTISDANTIVGEQTVLKTGAKSNVTMQRTTMPGKAK